MNIKQAVKVNLVRIDQSQNWLAADIGLSNGMLSLLLNGHREWKLLHLTAMSKTFKLKLSALMAQAEKFEATQEAESL